MNGCGDPFKKKKPALVFRLKQRVPAIEPFFKTFIFLKRFKLSSDLRHSHNLPIRLQAKVGKNPNLLPPSITSPSTGNVFSAIPTLFHWYK